MDLKDFKLYGLCIERLKHQIRIAKDSGRMCTDGRTELESFRTNEPEEIIDLLELYDMSDRTIDAIMEKLEELAEDASLFLERPIEFGFNDEGELSLYLKAQKLKMDCNQPKDKELTHTSK